MLRAPREKGLLFIFCVGVTVVMGLAATGVADTFTGPSQASLAAIGIGGGRNVPTANFVFNKTGSHVAGSNGSKTWVWAVLPADHTLHGFWR